VHATGVTPALLEPVAGVQEPEAPERETPDRVWRVVPVAKYPRAPSRVVGLLVHEALKAWRFPRDDPEGAFDGWVRARARGYGLTDAQQLADAVRQTRKLLDRLRAHPLYEEIVGAEVRQHEVPYSLEVPPLRPPRCGGGEEQAVSGRGEEDSGIIDVLYRSGGRWTLVEFKTDEVRHTAELERLLTEKEYRAQVGRYASAVERLLGERPRCLVCWLDVAGGVRVDPISPAWPER
jgi:ATP-dependent exoDNAse (exonuclease V) beta subunit